MKRNSLFFQQALILFSVCTTLFPNYVHAASLSVVPDATTVPVGSTFSATIYVDSASDAINASDGTLSFPPGLLQVRSLSYGSSVFTMWAQEPAFDNSAGSVSWSGGSNVAFNGSHGRVLRITFLAKDVGTASLLLPSASVYANDGLGTNVATAPNTSAVTIVRASPTPTPSPTPSGSPSGNEKIIISSPTNPSQDLWYASTTATLLLQVPSGADAIKTILSQQEDATPAITYRPPIAQKNVDGLTDGVWYFNTRGHYTDGWGVTTSFKIHVDTTPPTISTFSAFYDATSSELSILVSASDALSGVRDYALLIDGATSTPIKSMNGADGSSQMPMNLSVGTHTVQMRVFDMAGNEADSKIISLDVPFAGHKVNPILAWFLSINFLLPVLLLAILVALFLIIMNAVLWMRLRQYEHPFAQDVDIKKIRTLALSQLGGFKKDIASEVHNLECIHLGRNLKVEDMAEIKQIHDHLLDLETFVGNKIDTIEKK